MSDFIMQLVRQQFDTTKELLQKNNEAIFELEQKTEKSGETDGFQIVTFADLPTVTQTRFIYVSDGLDIGETAGNGTGCLAVYKPSLGNWYRLDNTVVAN